MGGLKSQGPLYMFNVFNTTNYRTFHQKCLIIHTCMY